MRKNEKWTVENIPEQNGRVFVVTGSSSGIGYETARAIAIKKGKVILAVRDLLKGKQAKANIVSQYNYADIDVMKLDLADLSSIENFVLEFSGKYTRLDILINNAGVMIPPYSKTRDGFELQMGTNHLGHFALTLKLMELIEKTPNSRIVNVSSAAHKYGNIKFEDFNWENRKYKAWRAYGDSKIANLYFTHELVKRMRNIDKKVLVTSAHPGWTSTELQRHSQLIIFLNKFFAMDQEQGALSTLRAAFDENAENGDFYGPSGFMEWKGYPVKVDTNDLAKDEKIAEKLWNISEKLTRIKINYN
jgi:NAD(P)-dependent dehydrogenase (short-subunit alcohol dehydrogenase family)